MSRMTIKTSAGFEFMFINVSCILYASPRCIEFGKYHSRARQCLEADKMTGLFTEIIMEEEDNDDKTNQ